MKAAGGQKVYVVADNLRVHHGKRVKAWAAEHEDEIELYYIPSYSPELNPDEYLNRDLKKNVHGRKAPRSQAELKENVMKKAGNTQYADTIMTTYFKPIDGHAWYFEGMSKEAIDKVRKGFEERYGKGALK